MSVMRLNEAVEVSWDRSLLLRIPIRHQFSEYARLRAKDLTSRIHSIIDTAEYLDYPVNKRLDLLFLGYVYYRRDDLNFRRRCFNQ